MHVCPLHLLTVLITYFVNIMIHLPVFTKIKRVTLFETQCRSWYIDELWQLLAANHKLLLKRASIVVWIRDGAVA